MSLHTLESGLTHLFNIVI